eukprot:1142365_1
MGLSLIRTVGIIYISLNALITIIVSIIGAKYVRKEFLVQKEKANQQSMQITLHEQQTNDKDEPNTESPKEDPNPSIPAVNKMSFIKLWLKIVWKMRSVYISLAVHIFDVLTDILVLIEWWYLEDESKGGEDLPHIDARLMALCAIITLFLHKIVSTLAFWIKERSVYRCVFQLLDVLIFEEIYTSHKRVLHQFKKQLEADASANKDKKIVEEAVETTTTFKYVRSLEAVFESIPQSVLQLVFIIRAGNAYHGGNSELLIISYISIFQSIVSMTNSIIKNDNVYMTADKWKKHRQRLPPTVPFLKHALCRLSEVVYRIGITLLALFWTVCGGEAFSVLLAVEILLILVLSFDERMSSIGVEDITPDEIFLRIQMLVILPSELVFAVDGTKGAMGITNCGKKQGRYMGFLYTIPSVIWTCFCCFWPAVMISRLWCIRRKFEHYIHPDFRIGISMMEYHFDPFWHCVQGTTHVFVHSSTWFNDIYHWFCFVCCLYAIFGFISEFLVALWSGDKESIRLCVNWGVGGIAKN